MTIRPEQITRELRYQFTSIERLEIAERLANFLKQRDEAIRAFVLVKQDHKENLEELSAHIRTHARFLSDGWEYRDFRCGVLYNSPEVGSKTIVRMDTGEQVAIEPMSDGERQEPLVIPPEPAREESGQAIIPIDTPPVAEQPPSEGPPAQSAGLA